MKEQSDDQLRVTLKSLGGDTRGNMKRETLVARIEKLQKIAERIETKEAINTAIAAENVAPVPLREFGLSISERIQVLQEKTGRTEPFLNALGVQSNAPSAPARMGGCSEADVLQAIESHSQRGMEAKFADNCWMFSRNGRMDSGTMSQPLYNIVKCADMVCQEAIPAARIGLTKSLLF